MDGVNLQKRRGGLCNREVLVAMHMDREKRVLEEKYKVGEKGREILM